MEQILENIMQKIDVKLKEKGMTKKEFSRKMGKSENWLTALPHVQKDIMLMDFIRACEILDVEPGYLLSDNYSKIVRYVSMDELVKIWVKKECENYLKENVVKLLHNIRNEHK